VEGGAVNSSCFYIKENSQTMYTCIFLFRFWKSLLSKDEVLTSGKQYGQRKSMLRNPEIPTRQNKVLKRDFKHLVARQYLFEALIVYVYML